MKQVLCSEMGYSLQLQMDVVHKKCSTVMLFIFVYDVNARDVIE